MKNRFYYEEIVANLLNPENKLLFYAHILGQCKLQMDTRFRSVAGVYFDTYQYILIVNPILFNKLTAKEKIAVLIHESMHIAYNHITVREKEDHERWNYACDIAINQLIPNIPKFGLHYYNFNLPENQTAETYYILLKDNPEFKKQKEIKKKNKEKLEELLKNLDDIDVSQDGSEIPDVEFDLDDFEVTKSTGDDEYRKDVTRSMLENAATKSRGNMPANYEKMIQLYDKKSVVDWRKALRSIVGNRKSNTRRTIMRLDRRFPKREDIRGKTKDTSFDLVVIMDVSGSMSNEMITSGLNEIKQICKLTDSTIKLIQVDTRVHEVSDFDKNMKKINRRAHGGTRIYPAVQYLKDNHLQFDAVVVISDMQIEHYRDWIDVPKKPFLFLNTTDKKSNWDGLVNKMFKEYLIKA